MFHHSTAPRSLCRTIFNMLPKFNNCGRYKVLIFGRYMAQEFLLKSFCSRFLFFNFSCVLTARSHGAQPGELAEPMRQNGRNKETQDPIPARAWLPFHAASAQTWRQQGWLHTFARWWTRIGAYMPPSRNEPWFKRSHHGRHCTTASATAGTHHRQHRKFTNYVWASHIQVCRTQGCQKHGCTNWRK